MHSIINPIDSMEKGIDKKKFTRVIFVDLQEIFDTADHNALL